MLPMRSMLMVCAMVAVSASASGQGGPPPTGDGTVGSSRGFVGRQQSGGSSSGLVSPVAWASASMEVVNGTPTLKLLVLWRGAPGWFTRGAGGGGGSSQAAGPDGHTRSRSWIRRGDLDLAIEHDATSKIAWIQGKEVKLGDANVILVDLVDRSGGPQVVGTLRVDGDLSQAPPGPAAILGVIGRSPELVSFVRCDLTLPDSSPAAQTAVARICALIVDEAGKKQ